MRKTTHFFLIMLSIVFFSSFLACKKIVKSNKSSAQTENNALNLYTEENRNKIFLSWADLELGKTERSLVYGDIYDVQIALSKEWQHISNVNESVKTPENKNQASEDSFLSCRKNNIVTSLKGDSIEQKIEANSPNNSCPHFDKKINHFQEEIYIYTHCPGADLSKIDQNDKEHISEKIQNSCAQAKEKYTLTSHKTIQKEDETTKTLAVAIMDINKRPCYWLKQDNEMILQEDCYIRKKETIDPVDDNTRLFSITIALKKGLKSEAHSTYFYEGKILIQLTNWDIEIDYPEKEDEQELPSYSIKKDDNILAEGPITDLHPSNTELLLKKQQEGIASKKQNSTLAATALKNFFSAEQAKQVDQERQQALLLDEQNNKLIKERLIKASPYLRAENSFDPAEKPETYQECYFKLIDLSKSISSLSINFSGITKSCNTSNESILSISTKDSQQYQCPGVNFITNISNNDKLKTTSLLLRVGKKLCFETTNEFKEFSDFEEDNLIKGEGFFGSGSKQRYITYNKASKTAEPCTWLKQNDYFVLQEDCMIDRYAREIEMSSLTSGSEHVLYANQDTSDSPIEMDLHLVLKQGLKQLYKKGMFYYYDGQADIDLGLGSVGHITYSLPGASPSFSFFNGSSSYEGRLSDL